MEKPKAFTEHIGKVVEAGERFEHVMAIALDPRTQYKEGVVRCITSREGNVAISGYIDRSALYKVHGETLDKFEIGEEVVIKNQKEIIKQITPSGGDFLGLEDPDIWIDHKTGLMHLYFTMPVKEKEEHHYSIHLGHAVGRDLDSLEMTEPVLQDTGENNSAKELSIAPLNSKGFHYNLIESSIKEADFTYSTVRAAIVQDMGKPWQFGETVFHPKEAGIDWIGGHASPGPLLPKTFLDLGGNKLLGIMNGREANQKMEDGNITYGMFSVGLFIYDYEYGKIGWVSPEPFIVDSGAVTITFASQFVETGIGHGILYAHVDDSFIRAYTLNAEGIKELLPK